MCLLSELEIHVQNKNIIRDLRGASAKESAKPTTEISYRRFFLCGVTKEVLLVGSHWVTPSEG